MPDSSQDLKLFFQNSIFNWSGPLRNVQLNLNNVFLEIYVLKSDTFRLIIMLN